MEIVGWIWFILTAIVSAISILCIKYLNKSQQWIYLVAIIGLEILAIYAYYNAFNYAKTGITYGIIKAISIILVAIGGLILFKEHLRFINIIGFIIIIVGIIMVSL